jgi:hypothetical protein
LVTLAFSPSVEVIVGVLRRRAGEEPYVVDRVAIAMVLFRMSSAFLD